MLNINGNTRILIKILVDRAYENKIFLEEMYEIMEGKKSPIGDNPDYCCHIKDGYRVVFSVEQHPSTLMKHISISHNGKIPEVEDVRVIIKEFGFKSKLEHCVVYREGDLAVNLMEAAI